MQREELRNRLKTATQRVVFIKKNGERRVMVCTLRPDVVKSYDFKDIPRKEPDNLLTVWDCDVQNWRRINLNTLQSVEDFALVSQ